MTPVREAMIVAGGRGTRLAPLTDATPKPLLPLVGLPFLSGLIRRLAAEGIERVLLVVGPDPSPFAVLGADAASVGVTLESVPEPEPLDTAGGVRSALDRVSGTFLVLNGDILTDLDLAALVSHHREHAAQATLSLTRVQDTSAYGVCVLDGNRIVDFVEKPPPGTLPGQDAVNAGTYVLEPGALAGFPQGPLSFERRVFPGLVAEGQMLAGSVSDAVWADLGTPERYLHGHRLVLDGEVAWPTVASGSRRYLGVDVEVAASATIREPVWVGAGTRIAPHATVGPYTVLGSGCRIGDRAKVVGAVLHDEVVVGEDAEVIDAVLGDASQLGARAQVGARALIGPGQRIVAGSIVPEGARQPRAAR